jgi:AcrR family transcriptional regulator
MPKIVDWDERRDEILSATWRVIARDGITGATIRAIAKEANCSRGILGHYFDDKADILGSALVLSHRRVGARMAQASTGLTGLAALRAVMLEALPLDERRDLEAQIEISFWGRALGNARLRELQHSEFDRLCARLHGHLQEAARLGELARDCDLRLATHQLVVLIDGLSAQRVLYQDLVTPQRQVEMLDHLLRAFRQTPASVRPEASVGVASDAD